MTKGSRIRLTPQGQDEICPFFMIALSLPRLMPSAYIEIVGHHAGPAMGIADSSRRFTKIPKPSALAKIDPYDWSDGVKKRNFLSCLQFQERS